MLSVLGESLRIAGVYETGVGFEDAGAVIPLALAQRLFNKEGQVSFFQVKLQPESVDEVDGVVQTIQDRLPNLVAYRSSEFAQNTPDIQTLQTLAGAVSIIGIVAGALGTLNTMLMSVFERTREIGTLRALGWRKRRILGMILTESQLLSSIGGLAGIGLGTGLIALLQFSPALSGIVSAQLTAEAVVVGMTVAIGLGVLGGFYPAWRASKLQPVEALRYE